MKLFTHRPLPSPAIELGPQRMKQSELRRDESDALAHGGVVCIRACHMGVVHVICVLYVSYECCVCHMCFICVIRMVYVSCVSCVSHICVSCVKLHVFGVCGLFIFVCVMWLSVSCVSCISVCVMCMCVSVGHARVFLCGVGEE